MAYLPREGLWAMYDELKKTTDFSVRITWQGNEDKPFYRAHFAAASQQHLFRHRPFWGEAVISGEEYIALVNVLERSGIKLSKDSISQVEDGYYLEIGTDERLYFGFLGFIPEAMQVLTRMVAVLKAENVGPITNIIERVKGFKI